MNPDNLTNPFNITKAVDFSDQEINDYWVDIPQAGGFLELAKPTSPMPMFILGGKGSGKTHLMRYFSYPLQKIRHQPEILTGLSSDRYVGIYLRCGGLNAARFQGKSQSDDAWATVFAYYMDLWLSQLVLSTVEDAYSGCAEIKDAEPVIVRDIFALFNDKPSPPPSSFCELRNIIVTLQRQLDSAVNNCAITRVLDVKVRATRGILIFGIPRILVGNLPTLSRCLVLYLIDEFENLSEPQQKYINTLIRERESPSSFKIGSRLYGVRTQSTYSADEENKEGSEFEMLPLDDRLRNNPTYTLFAMRLVEKRLHESRCLAASASDGALPKTLDHFFDKPLNGPFNQQETAFIIQKYSDRERPYFSKLRDKLLLGLDGGRSPGVSSKDTISEIISLLAWPQLPLVEKLNILLFYKGWASNRNLLDAARNIHSECEHFVSNTANHMAKNHANLMSHFRFDLLAQIYRDCGRSPKERYTGIETLIGMSWGVPRNLLILLKHIFSWAVFNGERPFEHKPISIKAQELGLVEASEWFYRDAKQIGTAGAIVQAGINRLGTLFRSIRFSDKPSECSCCAFSVDLTQVSDTARKMIDVAQKYSLIIDVGKQKDRNTERVDSKFQLNRMLAPRWDVPISRRGVLALTPQEVNSIFDPEHESKFDKFSKQRIDRMMAPFFGKRKMTAKNGTKTPPHSLLPGICHD